MKNPVLLHKINLNLNEAISYITNYLLNEERDKLINAINELREIQDILIKEKEGEE